MYMRPTVLNVECLFFYVELHCFWVGPINLEPNTSRRIWYTAWRRNALSCVTISLAASGLTFWSCMPNGFTHTSHSWEWHATELDVMIPKKGGYGSATCIFGVWDVGQIQIRSEKSQTTFKLKKRALRVNYEKRASIRALFFTCYLLWW
jgi:hypothetical protein